MEINDRKHVVESVVIATAIALFTGIINLVLDKFKKDKEEKKEDKKND